MNKFLITINCVVLGVNLETNEQYILSLLSDDIEFPSFHLTTKNNSALNRSMIEYLNTKLPESNELELIPQLITMNTPYIDTINDEHIHVIYGFVVDSKYQPKDSYWIPFNNFQPHKYANIIFEVIQKLY